MDIIKVRDEIVDAEAVEFSSIPSEKLARLLATQREYNVTIRVLAIVVEMLLKVTGAEQAEIGDAAIQDAPDLKAWRDDPRNAVVIEVARS